MSILLLFEKSDKLSYNELKATTTISDDQFPRHVQSLLEAKLLNCSTPVISKIFFLNSVQNNLAILSKFGPEMAKKPISRIFGQQCQFVRHRSNFNLSKCLKVCIPFIFSGAHRRVSGQPEHKVLEQADKVPDCWKRSTRNTSGGRTDSPCRRGGSENVPASRHRQDHEEQEGAQTQSTHTRGKQKSCL
jgi:hypothetical protein